MGHTYVVIAWINGSHGYTNEEQYVGESLIKAIRAMRKAKRVSGCVRLEWR